MRWNPRNYPEAEGVLEKEPQVIGFIGDLLPLWHNQGKPDGAGWEKSQGVKYCMYKRFAAGRTP